MILRGDLDLICQQIFDGMIAAAMTEFQLIGFRSVGEGQDLMTQTDTEDRNGADQLLHGIDHLGDILGVTGAVR